VLLQIKMQLSLFAPTAIISMVSATPLETRQGSPCGICGPYVACNATGGCDNVRINERMSRI
jgi:hypothetical protein